MEFASVALSTLLPKLGQLLQDEYRLQKGVREGIRFLYEELERTQAALRQVGEVPLEHLSELVRLWARDVREVSYDMEDIVDTFMVRVQGRPDDDPRSAKEFIKKMFNAVDLVTKVKTRHDVAKEIKGIKERVKEVAERRDR
jgi:disease resistance protein RPM1